MAAAGEFSASKAVAAAADAEGTAERGGGVADDRRERVRVEFGGVKRDERGKEKEERDLGEDLRRMEEA